MKKIVVLIALACLLAAVVVPVMATDCSGICGDINNDGSVDIGDFIYLSNYMWKGGPPPPCMNQADVNGDCSIDIGDFVYLTNYLWKGGPPPHCDCGM